MDSITDPFQKKVLNFILADASYPRDDFFTAEDWAVLSPSLEVHAPETLEGLVNCVSAGAAWRHERTGTEAKEHLRRVLQSLMMHAERKHECGPDCLANNFIATVVYAAMDTHFFAEVLQDARQAARKHAMVKHVFRGVKPSSSSVSN